MLGVLRLPLKGSQLLARPDRERLRCYASDSREYRNAFRSFLSRTDQKKTLVRALARHIARLPQRRVFLDVGAGNGILTHVLAPSFERTFAIEPNPFFQTDLSTSPLRLTVLPHPVLSCQELPIADLILCSHVLHYVDPSKWLEIAEKLLGRLSTSGLLAIVLQKRGSACMNLLDRFAGKRPFLDDLLVQLRDRHAHGIELRLETVPSVIQAGSLEETLGLTEFLLNVAHVREMPSKASVIDYIAENLVPCPEKGYSLSCDQDLLLIRRQS